MSNTRKISPLDNWIMDTNGDLLGVQNPNANGEDLLPVRYTTDPVTGRISLQAGGATMPSLYPNLYNFDPANYRNARAALAKVKSGVANMNVPCLGDSTTGGGNENGGATNANCVSYSYVRRLADQLTASGIAASWQNVIGDHAGSNVPTLSDVSCIATLDARVTAIPAGWGSFAGSVGKALGYNHFVNTTTANPITFTPTVTTDTLEVYYLDQSGYSPITVKGGAAGATASSPVSVTPGGTSRIKTATFTCAATSVWTIAGSGAAAVILLGWKAYNASTKEVSLLNCGNFSQKSDQPISTGNYWFALDTLASNSSSLISPLVIYMYGINDWLNNLTQAQTYANIATLATALQAAGTDLLIVIPPPSPTTSATIAQQQLQIAALYAAASAFGLAVVDMTARWTSQSVSYPLGYYRGAGDVHPSAMGYTDIAAGVKQFFAAL